MKASKTRVLVADDERVALEMTSTLLAEIAHVDTAETSAKALRLMNQHTYDLFLTDLHIQMAGDGLLLGGAMRALQPQCRIVLITGFPDFDKALLAIQRSFDHTILKPVDGKELQALARESGAGAPPPQQALGKATIWDVIAQQQSAILGLWLAMVESDPILGPRHNTPEERMDHMIGLVNSLAIRDERAANEIANAEQHGRTRREQKYRPHWVSLEVSYLRRAVFRTVLRNLLELDLSRFPHDMFEFNLRLDSDLLQSLEAFGLMQDR
ncbi:MAG TPA: response regulator [Terriglobales bacterium]|nr:response regulator [Terriglobales bacterium]